MIDSLDVSELTRNIVDAMRADLALGGDGVQCERSENEPADLPAKGWVCVYKTAQDLPIIIAGAGQGGRNHQIEIVVAIKHGDLSSGAEAEDNLEDLVKRVRDFLLNGGGQAGLVDYLSTMRVQYARYDKDETRFTQTAYMYVTFERRV